MINPTPTSAELLPCPFCGADPILDEIEAHTHAGGIAGFMPDHPGSFTIECPTTNCCGMIGDTRAEVVTAWNRRAAMQAAEPVPMTESESAARARACILGMAGMELTANLCAIPDTEFRGVSYIRREAVMDMVVAWRGKFDKAPHIPRPDAAPDRAPSIAPQPWQDRMDAHYAKGKVQCYSAEHFMLAEIDDWRGRVPSTATATDAELLSAFNSADSVIDGLHEVVRLRVASSTDSAADAKWKRLLKAASTYATGYCQDEADPGYGPGDLVCGVEQHERAKELFAAIAALQPEWVKP